MTINPSNLRTVIKYVLQENSGAVEDYQDGKDNAANFLTGQVMHATNGRADPNTVQSVIREEL